MLTITKEAVSKLGITVKHSIKQVWASRWKVRKIRLRPFENWLWYDGCSFKVEFLVNGIQWLNFINLGVVCLRDRK